MPVRRTSSPRRAVALVGRASRPTRTGTHRRCWQGDGHGMAFRARRGTPLAGVRTAAAHALPARCPVRVPRSSSSTQPWADFAAHAQDVFHRNGVCQPLEISPKRNGPSLRRTPPPRRDRARHRAHPRGGHRACEPRRRRFARDARAARRRARVNGRRRSLAQDILGSGTGAGRRGRGTRATRPVPARGSREVQSSVGSRQMISTVDRLLVVQTEDGLAD